jgi:hypothetical protein
MPLPLGPPRIQFIDADGHPYVGGTVETLIPGTSTPKDTWQDPDKAAVNTNPVVLDAAGRAIILGSADYRLIVRDVDGNLIYDGWTSTGISDAMLPFTTAPTLADARAMLGIDEAIQVETDRALAAEANLQTQINDIIAGDVSGSLQSQIDTERSERIAADANLQTQIDALGATSLKVGTNVTDSSGHIRVTFPQPFPNSTTAVVTQLMNSDLSAVWLSVNYDANGFDIWSSIPLADDTVHPIPAAFCWIATGN